MKKIKYLACAKVNHGTEENPEWEEVLTKMEICCSTQAAYDANYPIAEREAIPGTIEVSGAFDPEPETSSVWDELDKAYQEGVDSV